MSITKDGNQISLSRIGDLKNIKLFTIQDLPEKYYIFYNYAKQVCDKLRSKIPKTKIGNDFGKFYLYKEENEINFEGIFKNGYHFYIKDNESKIKIEYPDQVVEEIEIKNSNIPIKIQKMIKICQRYFGEMVKLSKIEEEED